MPFYSPEAKNLSWLPILRIGNCFVSLSSTLFLYKNIISFIESYSSLFKADFVIIRSLPACVPGASNSEFTLFTATASTPAIFLAAFSREQFLDVTMPGKKPVLGHLHLITQAVEEITLIFEKIGFSRVRYPEVEWDWYAFGALNFPDNHPARDDWETFFIKEETNPIRSRSAAIKPKEYPSIA